MTTTNDITEANEKLERDIDVRDENPVLTSIFDKGEGANQISLRFDIFRNRSDTSCIFNCL